MADYPRPSYGQTGGYGGGAAGGGQFQHNRGRGSGRDFTTRRQAPMSDMLRGRGGRGRLSGNASQMGFEARQRRETSRRKTIDHHSPFIRYIEDRAWQKTERDIPAIQPDEQHYIHLLPPQAQPSLTAQSVTTKFVQRAVTRTENNARYPVLCARWTPEGRRLVTGIDSGQLTLWNGLTFNFETVLQAHTHGVRAMAWNHEKTWMVTGDKSGLVRYWQNNMNNVAEFRAHKDSVSEISFSPTDRKLATCSADGTIRIWDFLTSEEERSMRGHGGDVQTVDWHPYVGLLVSGSRDNQQPMKMWDPRSAESITTLRYHRDAVASVKWNCNGHWLLSAGKDGLVKIFDLRARKVVQTFRGHKSDVTAIAWHPIYTDACASGGWNGEIFFWRVGNEGATGFIEEAAPLGHGASGHSVGHHKAIQCMDWHPLGHILATGSSDYSTKFWTRNRPGEVSESVSAEVSDSWQAVEETSQLPPGLSTTPGAPHSVLHPSRRSSTSSSIPGLN